MSQPVNPAALELADLLARAFEAAEANAHRSDATLAELLAMQEPARYARGDSAGRWITIGATEGEDGKRHGGSPVFIQGGRITKGAPGLTGRRLDALRDEPEHGTHRQQLRQEKEYQRARWSKQARSAGIDPQALHQLAGDIMSHDKAFTEDRRAMLQDARRKAKQLGSDLTTLKARASRGIDPAAVRALDDVAQSMASSYPEQFSGHEDDVTGRLFDLLAEGNPQAMSADDAYRQAFEHLAQEGESEAPPDSSWDDEPVPFARRGSPLSYAARRRLGRAAAAAGLDGAAVVRATEQAMTTS